MKTSELPDTLEAINNKLKQANDKLEIIEPLVKALVEINQNPDADLPPEVVAIIEKLNVTADATTTDAATLETDVKPPTPA